jgi:hypothetical protein
MRDGLERERMAIIQPVSFLLNELLPLSLLVVSKAISVDEYTCTNSKALLD